MLVYHDNRLRLLRKQFIY